MVSCGAPIEMRFCVRWPVKSFKTHPLIPYLSSLFNNILKSTVPNALDRSKRIDIIGLLLSKVLCMISARHYYTLIFTVKFEIRENM